MKNHISTNSFILFHLNTLFSSISIKDRARLIKHAYWGIRELVDAGIKFSLEANGRSLEIINEIDKDFITYLKLLIEQKKVEFVASGYVQIIAPLAPSHINEANLKIGLEVYKKILNTRPHKLLVNEMVFNNSYLEFANKFKFDGLVIDIDNLSISQRKSKKDLYEFSHISSQTSQPVRVFWSDSRLFQSFQRYIHGDIDYQSYLSRLSNHLREFHSSYIPLYTNDLEIFNFRPGRFEQEKSIFQDEWKKIAGLCNALVEDNWNFHTLSELSNSLSAPKGAQNVLKLSNSVEYAVSVKKQSKYNITRWSITGRCDQRLNTMCYQLSRKKFFKHYNKNDKVELLTFWSSDLRTHICQERLEQALLAINKFYKRNSIEQNLESVPTDVKGKIIDAKKVNYIRHLSDNILEIKKSKLTLLVNLNKGLTIKYLSFGTKKPVIASYDNDHFDSINYGVDFFSGGMLLEIPSLKKRITDFEISNNLEIYDKNGCIVIKADFDLSLLKLTKILHIYPDQIRVEYFINAPEKYDHILRLGNLLFNKEFLNIKCIQTKAGSNSLESYDLNSEFNHSAQVSTIVSASSGFPSSNNEIIFLSKTNPFKIIFFNETSYSLPMFINEKINNKDFFRLIFSLSEIDDNSQKKHVAGYFSFIIKNLSKT